MEIKLPFVEDIPEHKDQERMTWLVQGQTISGSRNRYRPEGNINRTIWQVHRNVQTLYNAVNHIIVSGGNPLVEITEVKDNIKEIEQDLENVHKAIKEASRRIDESEDDIHTLTLILQGILGDINDILDIIDSLDEIYANKEIEGVLDENYYTKEEIDERIDEVNSLQETVDTLQEQLWELRDVVESLYSHEQIESEINRINGEFEELYNYIQELERRIEELENESGSSTP